MNQNFSIEECENQLIATMIVAALNDLHNKWSRKSIRKAKNYYEKYAIIKAKRNKVSAQWFFKSKLFKLTGLDFDYLNRHYKDLKRNYTQTELKARARGRYHTQKGEKLYESK